MKIIGVLYLAIASFISWGLYQRLWPLPMSVAAGFVLTFIVFYVAAVPTAILWAIYKFFKENDK